MKNKTIKRRIASLVLSFLMIFNLIPPIANFNYNNEVVAEKSTIEEKKQDKDKIKKKIENKKLENENKISEDSNKTEKTEDKTKKDELKEHKKIEIKKEKAPENLNGSEKKNNKVEIENKQLESEKSNKKLDELNKIKRDAAALSGLPQKRDKVEIKNIKILNFSNQEIIPGVNGLKKTDYFKMKFDWDATIYQNELKEGDYFEVKLPDNFKFSTRPMTSVVPLKTQDKKHVIAEATIESKGKDGGGNIKIVFTDYVKNRYHVKGDMFLQASFVQEKIQEGQINDFEIGAGITIQIDILPPPPPGPPGPPKPPLPPEVLQKWGYEILDSSNKPSKVKWVMRINHRKGTFQNVVITDKLTYEGTITDPNFKVKYDPDSFQLSKVTMDQYGNVDWNTAQEIPKAQLKTMLSFNADKTAFELRLGNVDGEQYHFQYDSTYQPGLKLKNEAVFKAQEVIQKIVERYYEYNKAGGNGDGDLLSKIKIIKVSSENENLKLKGAKFRITKKATGETFDLITDDNGEAVSELLVPGEYEIQEITPPPGFLPDDQVYTVEVQGDQATIKTIRNVPEKTSVKVTKTWIGPVKQVTIKLFKTVGGVKTEVQSKILNTVTGWTHTFTNLPKYENGVEIEYSVDEEVIPGYQKDITKNGENDYTITNRNVEEVSVKVTKTWIGPVKQVTIKLFKTVGGVKTEVQSKILNTVTGWTHTFTNLPKYENGEEIEYSVDEEAIPGYQKNITKNGENDYTITNKNVEEVSVKVTKTWIGPAKQVTIKLFKTVGGVKTEVQSKLLNAGTGWTHTFTNLPKYENGVEIEYTVDEEVVPGYQKDINKNGENDYTITNKNIEKVEIKVKKEWIGPSVSEITVNLLANGVKIQSQKLNKENNWSHTFTDLPKYEGVNEIIYTIEEVKVDGYESKITKNADNDYTITNKNNEKTEIKVEKQWIGPSVSEITVNLLANGKLKDSVKLNAGNNWKHTFKNLNRYENGEEVNYTIEEVKIDGYESKLIKKGENSYIIVNINKASIEIPVIKKWVGPAVSEVTVNLLVNGKLKESIKLNEGNNWKHIFKNLPKYDESTGEEIIYSVSENALEGYETLITGNMKEGFTIVNTIVGKLSIGVTKEWIGKEADSVIVNLLADGVKVQSQKLSKHNNWQHIFSDLEKYKDGVEIVYTIEEEVLEGYRIKIKGDANTGFNITNIEKPKKPKKPPTPTPNPKPKKPNPKTGDSTNISYINLTVPYVLKTFKFKKDEDESDE